jgi:hypothetical protein
MVPVRCRHLVAAALVTALAGAGPAFAGGGKATASWSGRVLDANRGAPRASVVVGLLDEHGEWSARSSPTRADGAFAIPQATPGAYRLAVETPEGMFVLAEPLALHAGANTPKAVTLYSGATYAQQEQGLGQGTHAMRPMVQWIIAGSIGVAALFALAEVSKDETESCVSPPCN